MISSFLCRKDYVVEKIIASFALEVGVCPQRVGAL
jgi:hypothetical protein